MTETTPDIDMSQFCDLFVSEGQEHVHTLNRCMLALERAPDDVYALRTMFRTAHSLKGSAATMNYDTLATLAHAAEDVLHKLRDGDWTLTPGLTDLLFAAIDVLQALVDDVAAGGPGEADTASILEQLRSYEPQKETESVACPEPSSQAKPLAVAEQPQRPCTTMIRIDVEHLDTLLDLVTEMVIHRSLLTRLAQRYDLPPLKDALEVHDRLLVRLQNGVLKMRMVPIGQVFGRFPRMVRDLLKAEGKKAQLILEGEEVELDRTALEMLGDPLMHLLRNGIDHGLETPAEREAAGKPPTGTLRMSARQERGMVIIEVSDDGRGMVAQRVATAAVERGIVTTDEVTAMSESHVLELICHPGFSLSEEVTAVSGRGVGMGVVKQQLEALHGSLQIETKVGQGTTFRLQLPAMLALVQALLVSVGDEQYALPTTYVERTIELDPARIERIGDRELLHLEEGTLPLQRLGKLLHVPGCEKEPRHALVIRRNGHSIGLRVDDILEHEEIVVKPLPTALRGTPGLAGVTILGEGQIVLILDAMGL